MNAPSFYNEWAWDFVASTMHRNPRLVEWLLSVAQRTPYEHLGKYMQRWWLLPPAVKPEHPEFRSIRNQVRRLRRNARLHLIMRADQEPYPHNHPWEFRTLVLRGWYVEELLLKDGTVTRNVVWAGQSYKRTPDQFHRIVAVAPGGVLTLVLHRTKKPTSWWGFLVNGKCIHWRIFQEIMAAGRGWDPSIESQAATYAELNSTSFRLSGDN